MNIKIYFQKILTNPNKDNVGAQLKVTNLEERKKVMDRLDIHESIDFKEHIFAKTSRAY